MSVLTLAEAAARLNLSPSTLRWQITNGRLRADKLGTQWIVDEAEVERYRRENQGTRLAGAGKVAAPTG